MSVRIHDIFPPELIADEYVRHNRDNKVLYVFYDAKHEHFKDYYKEIFENETCKCAKMFKITTKEEVINHINVIIDEENHDAKDCFMLLFLGSLEDTDNPDLYTVDTGSPIKGTDVWRPIANSPRFTYRPKVFIFHAFYEDLSNAVLDARRYVPSYMERKVTYDIPREADVLIVHKQTSFYVSDCRLIGYFNNLKKNLKNFGQRDDLVNILTYTKCGNTKDLRPLIVSTLRKKIYMATSDYRSHWYTIRKDMDEYLEKLKQINKHLKSKKNPIENVSEPTTSVEGMPKKRKH